MHPVRQTIIIRWVLYVLVIAGVAAWVLTRNPSPPQFKASAMQRLAPTQVEMPPAEVTETLAKSIQVLKGKSPAFTTVEEIQPSLIILYEEEAQDEEEVRRAPLSLSAVFMGPPHKFVIVNGVVYQLGDKLPDGRIIKAIDQEGIVVAENGTSERVAWKPQFRVELQKPEQDKPTRFRPDIPLEEDAGQTAKSSQQVDLQNLPSDMSPDQALQVLQKIGSQQQQ